MYKEVEGDLITLAKAGAFDVISHGCNCFCSMGAGIAPLMAKAFGCDIFEKEQLNHHGDINKLGTIDFEHRQLETGQLTVVNSYSQYGFGKNHSNGTGTPLDYEALTLCLRKMNVIFSHKHIGLPQIGCGLAGGDWERVRSIIQTELSHCDVTVVIYKP